MFTASVTPNARCPRRLCSKASGYVVLRGLRQPSASATLTCRRAAGPRGRAATRVAASAAQPLLRVAGRIAARTLPAWLAAVRGISSARLSPILVVGLVAYSVGVTIWAANSNRSQSSSSAAAADTVGGTASATQAPATAAVSTTQPLPATQLTAASSAPTTASPTAKPWPAPAPAPSPVPTVASAAATPKADGRVTCKVCGGSGTVSYENHMEEYEARICPCCLGKGRVRNMKGDLLQALLTFDP